MEQITISGDEWSVDEQCIVHQAGNQFQIVLKKRVIDSLKLEGRDIVKIYVKKEGHTNKEKRKISSGFGKNESPKPEQPEPGL